MRTSLFCLLLACISVAAPGAATGAGSISGKVVDDSGKPVRFASILLMHASDSGLVKTELTNEQGEYLLTPVTGGTFIIKVALSGYTTFISDKFIVANNSIPRPDITIKQKSTELNEVSVRAQKPFIEVRPDMLVVNVENSIVSAGSSVMDVLARSPGVNVDQDDNISLKGKSGVNVMIDGKIQPISGDELANLLKSMPAASIDKIELISNPSARYDAAGTAGIINIRTKKDQRMGFNGSVHGSYGQSIYHSQTGGINLNYRNKKINAWASYNYYYREGLNDVFFYRQFYNAGILTGAYDQHNYTTVPNASHTALAGIDYMLSPKTTIGLSVKGQNTSRRTKGFYYSKVLDSVSAERSYFTTDNVSSGQWYNYVPNLHLKHSFDTGGRELTADLDYGRYWNHNNQDFITNYYLPDGSATQAPYLLHGIVSGITQIRGVKADYASPLPGNAHLDAGIKSSYTTADNQPAFYDRSTDGNVYDSSKSDHFAYTENINAAYINASKELKKTSIQLGLRAEQTIATGTEKTTGSSFHRDYTQLFPNVALQQHLNADNDLGISLSRRIERPNYQQLNPFKFFVDPSTYKEGNPYLNPSLTYNAELSYVYKQRLITTVYYSRINDVITDLVIPADINTHVAKQTEVNLGLVEYYGISGSYNIQVTKWWNTVNNVNAYYNKYNAFLVNTPLKNGLVSYDLHSTNSIILPANWSAEVTLYYQSLQEYGYLNIRPTWSLSTGIQKNLFDKKMTVRLNAADIFYTGYNNAYSDFTDYSLSFIAKHDNRQVSISLTYRFGNKAIQATRHKAGAEEEERRAEANS